MRKLLMTSVAVFLTSCGFNAKDIHPTFIDYKTSDGAIWEAIDSTPKQCGDPSYIFVNSGKKITLEQMNGWICVKPSEAALMRKYYNEYLKKNSNCP